MRRSVLPFKTILDLEVAVKKILSLAANKCHEKAKIAARDANHYVRVASCSLQLGCVQTTSYLESFALEWLFLG